MPQALLLAALRGMSHLNTDLDAQTFLLRVRQVRQAAGADPTLPVRYVAQVTAAELADPRVLIWDIGRTHEPQLGNFDHHQDHRLGATPMILCQWLGEEPSALDRYVDLADRGHFFREPQPHPHVETLHGLAAGINVVYDNDDQRSIHYQDLLTWVETADIDPWAHLTEAVLPERFWPFLQARRAEETVAREAAGSAQWYQTSIGKIAYIASDAAAVMRVLYGQGAALVILHEPEGRMPGWSRTAPHFLVGANPALVRVPEQVDLRPLFAQLSQLEPVGFSWGGQAGVGGSPREEGGSALSAEQVVHAVRSYLG